MNPDCRDGKHATCSGDGWDVELDKVFDCPCTCHAPAFTCGDCGFLTDVVKEGMAHAASTSHELTAAVDNEGTTITISAVPDDDGWFTAEEETA
jgi:hypothetical protein